MRNSKKTDEVTDREIGSEKNAVRKNSQPKKNLLKAPILGNHSLFNDVSRRLELKKLILGVS